MTTDTIFTGATEPLADFEDTRADALADLLLGEPDHYERWGIVQAVREAEWADPHADGTWMHLDSIAWHIDEDEREARRGRAS